MSDKKRAEKAVVRALASTETAKKAKSGLKKAADKKMKELGIPKKQLAKIAAAAKILRDRKVTLKKKLGKNTSISGTADLKNKAYSINLNHSF